MKEEYSSLRTEILYWQNFRFVLLGASIAFVSGVLGFALKQSEAGASVWYAAASLILFVLACAASLSCYAGRGNARIGTYLNVFHEPPLSNEARKDCTTDRLETLGWEGRRRRFWCKLNKRSPLDCFTLNHWLAVIYLILGGVSATLLWYVWYVGSEPSPAATNHQWMFIGSVGVVFLVAVICLAFFSSPSKAYLNSWVAVKNAEGPRGNLIRVQGKVADMTLDEFIKLITVTVMQITKEKI